MFKQIFILVLFLLPGLYNDCFPQVNVEWFRTYGAGWGKNFMNDFVMDSSGNSYLTGSVSKNSSNSRTAIGTVKFNPNGDLKWAQNYEGSNFSYAEGKALVVDKNENVYVTGICTDNDSSENYCTIKYNSTGEILWIKKYHSSPGGRDFATDITLDNYNNIYVTGYTYYYGGSQYFWSTLKYDSMGNLIWVTRYEGDLSKGKRSRSIIVDDNQNVYVSGFKLGASNSNEFCTIKYNQSGQQQWISIFDNSGLGDQPSDMTKDNFGNIYILGQNYGSDGFYTSIVKYDNNGNEIWNVMTDSTGRVDFSYYLHKISFKLDSENNIYVATTYRNYFCTIKYNSFGSKEWISKYNSNSGTSFSNGIGINIDELGDIYTTGLALIGNIVPFITIKYNQEGLVLWERQFHNNSAMEFDEGAFVGLDKNNSVYIAGNHSNSNSNYSALYGLLKYSQGIGISNISSEIPDSYILHQNFPNPFNPVTVIRYSLIEDRFTTLKVYDALGKIVSTLVNEKQNAGTYEVDFDGSELSSGVYYYKLSSGNFSQTKRMLLLK